MTSERHNAMRAGTAAHLMGGWRTRGFVSFGLNACPNTPSNFITMLSGADYLTNCRVSGQQQSPIRPKQS